MNSTHQPPPTDVIGRTLVHVQGDFKALIDAPVWSLDADRLDERFAQVMAVRAAADELAARLAGEMTDRGHAKRLGGSSTRAHLMGTHRLSKGEASRVTAAVKHLHGSSTISEPVRRAQAAGEVSQEQATVIAKTINQISPDHPVDRVEAAQADLVRYAGQLPYSDLQRVANHVLEVVDRDRADELLEAKLQADEQAAIGNVELNLRVKPDGTSDGWFKNLPPAQTAMFSKAVEAFAAPRRRHLHKPSQEALEPLDQKLDTSPDQLPYPNRLGRAFCELIEHLPTDGLPSHGNANATIVITIDETKLRAGVGEATLDTGGSLSTSEGRRLACNAGILPMVLNGDSKVLDLGMAERLFTRYQRLALANRDGGCVFPRCDRPPARCEAHHCRYFSDGGSTDLANGALLCSFHHHLIHQGDWQIHNAADGIPEAIPPPWVDPEQRPIRHHRFKPKLE